MIKQQRMSVFTPNGMVIVVDKESDSKNLEMLSKLEVDDRDTIILKKEIKEEG